MRTMRQTIGCGLATVLLALAGCDSGPETPPMDQPIDRDAAMDVDAQLRQGTDELLKERESENEQ